MEFPSDTLVVPGYETPALSSAIDALASRGFEATYAREIVGAFCNSVGHGSYRGEESVELLDRLLAALEAKIAEFVGTHSLSYWLHFSRRLPPYVLIGTDQQPATKANVHQHMNAAFQKYSLQTCQGLAFSSDVDGHEILSGALMGNSESLAELRASRQLVLTRFSEQSLVEYFELHALCYQMWRAMSVRRCIGKGMPLVIGANGYGERRTQEFNRMVQSFDHRRHQYGSGACKEGMVFGRHDGHQFLVPVPNVAGMSLPIPPELQAPSKYKRWVPNYVFQPLDILGYWVSHKPYLGAFKRKHGVGLDEVLAVLWSLLHSLLSQEGEIVRVCRFGYRLMEDQVLRQAVRRREGAIARLLGVEAGGSVDVDGVLRHLTWEQAAPDVRITTGGPIRPLVRTRHGLFLDYASFGGYVWSACHALPTKNTEAKDKGRQLEDSVCGAPALPRTALKSRSDGQRQIDCSWRIADVLLIGECRARGWSFGFEAGDPAAISHRIRAIDQMLNDADEKGKWLARNTIGRNYSVRDYKYIVPIGISAFVEYIPHESAFYWIVPGVPRVMSHLELMALLSGPDLRRILLCSCHCYTIGETEAEGENTHRV